MELKQLIDEWEAFILDQLFVERNQMMLLRPPVFITICCILIALAICCFCNCRRNYSILHFNGSDINQHNKGGAGCIIRNKQGEFVIAGAYNLDDLNKYPKRPRNYCVLHFNGSDINQHNKGGAGCIIRNKEGELVVAGAYNLDDLNRYPKQFHVAIAGAVAFRNGLKLAKQNNVKLHLIKGKNEEVINRVRDQQKRRPEDQFLSELIEEIKKALYQQSIDPQTQVKLIEEEANRVAHDLAYYGSKDSGYPNEKIYFREDDLPPKVAQLLQLDKTIWRA